MDGALIKIIVVVVHLSSWTFDIGALVVFLCWKADRDCGSAGDYLQEIESGEIASLRTRFGFFRAEQAEYGQDPFLRES